MTSQLRVLRVVGARPQFVQAKPLSEVLATRGHDETLLHTGQHYDPALDGQVFAELGLREPDVSLGVGSGPHGWQTGLMLERIEAHLLEHRYDVVLVDGDTNSTLAGALAAAKLHVPVAHVEAGMRSFDLRMPEEVNRRLTDHVSTFLFAPSAAASRNLASEAIADGVHLVGDVLAETFEQFKEHALARAPELLRDLGLEGDGYVLLTLHRPENVDDAERLRGLVDGLARVPLPVCWPMHPRTRGRLEEFGLGGRVLSPPFGVIEPLGYLNMLALESAAAAILTDSGGVQREAYHWKKPAVILRDRTEWPEIVESGWGRLTTHESPDVWPPPQRPAGDDELYEKHGVSERVVDVLEGAAA